MKYAVELENVNKRWRLFHLKNLGFRLPQGEILGMIGPNGAGKTTALRILLDLVRLDSGRVRIFGLDHRKHLLEIKRQVGFVGENPRFYSDKTVAWTGDFAGGFYTNWDVRIFRKILDDFSLDPTKKIRDLSNGMKVKLHLALALSHHPELLILDEPTAGLDPIIRRELLDRLLRENRDHGTSVLISSHITDDITRIADRILFLIQGRSVIHEEKDRLLDSWKRLHFKDGALGEDVVRDLLSLQRGAFGHSGLTPDFRGLFPLLREGLSRGTVKVENITLDDILIALVEGGHA